MTSSLEQQVNSVGRVCELAAVANASHSNVINSSSVDFSAQLVCNRFHSQLSTKGSTAEERTNHERCGEKDQPADREGERNNEFS